MAIDPVELMGMRSALPPIRFSNWGIYSESCCIATDALYFMYIAEHKVKQ